MFPGDTLVFTCYYDTRSNKTGASKSEVRLKELMCSGHLYYYPATRMESCKSTLSKKTLAGYFDFIKMFVFNRILNRKFTNQIHNNEKMDLWNQKFTFYFVNLSCD